LKTRIIAGILMLPLLLVVYIGGYVLLGTCLIIGILGVREFYNGFRKAGVSPCDYVAYAAAAALYALNISGVDFKWYMLWFFGVVLACALYMFNVKKRKAEDGAATMLGIFYIIFFSYHVTLIQQIAGFSILLWLVFITAFGTDIAAYFTGSAIGKHKLCPDISPKKTVEGAIGGALGSVILCGVFGYFFAFDLLIHCLILGAVGGVFAQLGDLTASVFKRSMGIKDFGSLIPGHGGVLDRFDSVLFTAPAIYYYIALVLA